MTTFTFTVTLPEVVMVLAALSDAIEIAARHYEQASTPYLKKRWAEQRDQLIALIDKIKADVGDTPVGDVPRGR